jgi:hypothetical protein
MSLIIKADARRAAQKTRPIKAAVFGASGTGKTTQARTLDPKKTLFLDLEAGTLAIDGWDGDVVSVRDVAVALNVHPWEVAQALALYLGGPDPATADRDGDRYNKAYYDQIVEVFKADIDLSKYDTIFVDSITEVSRQCFAFSRTQPEAFSAKTGEPDTRGAYGILGREMVRWLKHLQHAPFSVIVVGILNEEKDDLGRKSYVPQVEGSKTGNELPGIFDLVLTLTSDKDNGRQFVCHQNNPLKYPAKDRSGTLELHEPADLGKLLKKVKAGKRIDIKLDPLAKAE